MRLLLQRTQGLLVWLGVLPIMLAFAAYWYSSQHTESVELTLASDEYIRAMDDLLSTVKDAETGQRGYLLTGNPRYAKPFHDARAKIEAQFASFAQFASTGGVDVETLNKLHKLVNDKMAELATTTQIRRTQGLAAAMQIVETNRGETDMIKIRELVSKLREEQFRTFHKRLEEQQRRQRYLDVTLVFGVLASSLLLLSVYRMNMLYARERDRIEAEITRANQELELRVKERTVELEQRTVELQKSNTDLSQFAYVASHDLQEPLRMVASYVGLLARRYKSQLDGTADEYIQFAVEGATRMQTLINDLLVYSRAGTQAVHKEPIPSEFIVQQALANLNLALRESAAEVYFHDLPVIEGDLTKLTQVMQNLIANAIKFQKPEIPPEIHVAATKIGNEWIFSVKDNGIGFDTKYTEKIFQIFQRLHGASKYSGTGIGLAISKRIVEHHGGRLWADSEPGIGSTFFFTLPIFDNAKKI